MIRPACVVILFSVVIGCSVPTKSWPNESKDLVWTAMIAAAKTPDYSSSDPRKRWVIVNNDVVINEQLGRILVHRKLTRSLQLPRQKEQTDNREWYFVIQLIPEGEPTVTFDAQGIQLVPARIVDEANRYFLLIDEVLHPIQ